MVEEFDLIEHYMSRRRMDSKYPYACPSWCRLGKKAVLICDGFTLSKPTEPSANLTVLLSLQSDGAQSASGAGDLVQPCASVQVGRHSAADHRVRSEAV